MCSPRVCSQGFAYPQAAAGEEETEEEGEEEEGEEAGQGGAPLVGAPLERRGGEQRRDNGGLSDGVGWVGGVGGVAASSCETMRGGKVA